MSAPLSLEDLSLKGKVVLLRADLNVPMNEQKRVTDTTRIDRLKPTIEYLKKQGARTVILSHFGRPKGEKKAEFSLSFLPETLEKQWGTPVGFYDGALDSAAKNTIDKLENGAFILFENLRFNAGEEKNDADFAAQLSSLGDIYVNDAFSASHRAHASTEALAKQLPCAAGFLMAAEIKALKSALETPQKPVVAIIGGAKISTKLALLNNLCQKVDVMFLGGGMASTFLYAKGAKVGNSLCEKEMKQEALEIMESASKAGCEIILPEKRIAVEEFGANVPFEVVDAFDIPDHMEAVDIAPEALEILKDKLKLAKTVIWNGPLGVFEVKPFDGGTNMAAQLVAELTKQGELVSVAGGGDTVAALENAGCAEDFTYISTAGGAFLEWLEGKELPGVAALEKHANAHK